MASKTVLYKVYFTLLALEIKLNATPIQPLRSFKILNIVLLFSRNNVCIAMSEKWKVGCILGDPGADSGSEGKSKRAEKYIWNEEK